MKTYVKGDTYQDPKDDYTTYGITEFDRNHVQKIEVYGETIVNLGEEHAQKIEVYGDEDLCDRIIKLLNEQEIEFSKSDEIVDESSGSVEAAPENLDETIDEPSVEWVGSDDLGPTDDQFSRFEKEVEDAINRTCMENGSNTPDFILAEYLVNCLRAFNKASRDRERWFGKELKI